MATIIYNYTYIRQSNISRHDACLTGQATIWLRDGAIDFSCDSIRVFFHLLVIILVECSFSASKFGYICVNVVLWVPFLHTLVYIEAARGSGGAMPSTAPSLTTIS